MDVINHEELWIGDTGASTHMTFTGKGMSNLKACSTEERIVMGNGEKATTSHLGDIEGQLISKNGEKEGTIKLQEVSYSPNVQFNLLSITKLLKQGWQLGASAEAMTIKKNVKVLKIDYIINTHKGMLFCIRIRRN